MDRAELRAMLTGGDRRSIGRAEEVVALVRDDLGLVPILTDCLADADAIVAMRAADAIEKLSREDASYFEAYKDKLLTLTGETTQIELRWHLAQILPRLSLSPEECRTAARIFESYLTDTSSIVKTNALQGLFELALQVQDLREEVRRLLQIASHTGTPAMRARCRKLLQELAERTLRH